MGQHAYKVSIPGTIPGMMCVLFRQLMIIIEAFYDRGSPYFSEAPYLRSPIPRPKTDFGKNKSCIPMNHPMAQIYKNVIILRKKSGLPTILG